MHVGGSFFGHPYVRRPRYLWADIERPDFGNSFMRAVVKTPCIRQDLHDADLMTYDDPKYPVQRILTPAHTLSFTQTHRC